MENFVIQNQIAEGQYGTVFKAIHKQSQEYVAIKRLKDKYTLEEGLQLREVQALKRLQHPNVIQLKTVCEQQGYFCMIFEYADKNLYECYKKQLSETRIRTIIYQILEGLHYIHSQGLFHRYAIILFTFNTETQSQRIFYYLIIRSKYAILDQQGKYTHSLRTPNMWPPDGPEILQSQYNDIQLFKIASACHQGFAYVEFCNNQSEGKNLSTQQLQFKNVFQSLNPPQFCFNIIIMNNEFLEIEDQNSQLIEFNSKIREESMCQVEKYQLLNDTQAFNNTKQQDEINKKTLVKLIYLLNQGTLLNNQEKEQLFFRITKLFQFIDFRLRVLAYKSIKMLMPIQIKILIQSIVKDLISDNWIIKIEALRTISLIQEEQDFLQIERFINNALLDDNTQIASTALIIGIHISNRFPNIVKKWDQEIQKKFYQKEECSLYHTLILLHNLKNGQINYLKILLQLTQFKLYPTMTIQIIRLSKQLLPQLDNNSRLEFIKFLKQQLNNRSYEIFLESAKVLIDVMEIQHKEYDIMMNVIIQKLQQPLVNNIETYSALNLLDKLIIVNKEPLVLKKQQIIILERMVVNSHITLSLKALQISIKLNQQNTVEHLQSIYIQTSTIDGQTSFLMGLKELVIVESSFEQQALKLLKLIFLQDCDPKIVDIAIKLVEEMLNKTNTLQTQLIQLLFWITEKRSIQQKFQVIELLNRLFINLKINKLKQRVALIWYKYLKEFADQNQFNTENLLNCAYILLNYTKLNQEQIRLNLNKISRHKITQYDQINQISLSLQENKQDKQSKFMQNDRDNYQILLKNI